MTLGTILGASFRVLRRNPRPVVGISLIIHVVLAVISLVTSGFLAVNALTSYFNDVTANNVSSSTITTLLLAFVASFTSAIFTFGGDTILLGIITVEVARGTVGEKLPLAALWNRARGRIAVLIGWAALVMAVVLVVITVYLGAIVLLMAFGGGAGIAIGAVLIFVGLFGFIALGIWFATKLSLVPSILVLERPTLGAAIRRSWSLVRGYFWRTFGIEILVAVILAIASQIVVEPFSLIALFIFGIGNPSGLATGSAAFASFTQTTQVVSVIAGALAATITAVISSAATALIYIDLRMRKEGLDLTLSRFVDARQAGSADLPDPYAPTGTPTLPSPAASSPSTSAPA
jgi:hypothetical protein